MYAKVYTYKCTRIQCGWLFIFPGGIHHRRLHRRLSPADIELVANSPAIKAGYFRLATGRSVFQKTPRRVPDARLKRIDTAGSS